MMKHIFILIFFAALISGCTEDVNVNGPTVRVGDGPQLSAPSAGATFVLAEEQAAATMTTFEWSAADFGFPAAVTYEVSVDIAGNDFADGVLLGATNSTSLDVIQEKMNNILLTKGSEEALPVNLVARVSARVSPEVETLVSDVIPLTVTPYIVEIVYPQLQVPGSYQGWDPANNLTVIYSRKSDGRYEGYQYFSEDGVAFKYTDGPSWDVNFGDDGADGTLESGSGDIFASDAGMYKLNVDLNNMTHEFLLTNWGVIGSATPGGWDSDVDMVYNEETRRLEVTMDLVAGEIKFRINDGWDLDFGDNDTNASLEYGGANIPVLEGGNYTIELILNEPKYTYRIIKN